MNVLIYGGVTGAIGSQITEEARRRGHDVTAVVRAPRAPDQPDVVGGDVLDSTSVAALARGRDAVLSAVGAGIHGSGPHYQIYRKAAESLVDALRSLGDGAPRLIVVGAAGSLETGTGMRLVDTPQFPAIYREEALAQAEALDYYLSIMDVRWTYVSPAVLIEPGERTGRYRTGGDQLLTDGSGESRISIEDYAAAFVDELEKPQAIGRRLSVAY